MCKVIKAKEILSVKWNVYRTTRKTVLQASFPSPKKRYAIVNC
jgi:hypothetical protein